MTFARAIDIAIYVVAAGTVAGGLLRLMELRQGKER